jgi:hypothetical protein
VGAVTVHAGPTWQAALQSPLARMRLSRERACVERLLGSMEFYAAVVPPAIVGGPRTPLPVPRDARAIDVALFSARMRYSLRCAVR